MAKDRVIKDFLLQEKIGSRRASKPSKMIAPASLVFEKQASNFARELVLCKQESSI